MTDDHTTEPYRTTHDWRSESLTTTVVAAISEGTSVGSTDFNLDDHVDPNALNALFRPRLGGSLRTGGKLQFVVQGSRVVIHSNGKILVYPTDDAEVAEE